MIHEDPYRYIERHFADIKRHMDAELARRRRRERVAAASLMTLFALGITAWAIVGVGGSPLSHNAPASVEVAPSRDDLMWNTDSRFHHHHENLRQAFRNAGRGELSAESREEMLALLRGFPFHHLEPREGLNVAVIPNLFRVIMRTRAVEYRQLVEGYLRTGALDADDTDLGRRVLEVLDEAAATEVSDS